MTSPEHHFVRVGELECSNTDWHVKNNWVDDTGRVFVEAIARFIDKKWNERTREVVREMKQKQSFLARTLRPLKSLKFDEAEMRNADSHARNGGDTIYPRMFTISFPGKERGVLFRTLKYMKLRTGQNGDYHAMNDNKEDNYVEFAAFPREWLEIFANTKEWQTLVKHLTKACETKAMRDKVRTGQGGPRWFTDHWGPSAFHVAKNSAATGSGVVVCRSWPGYKTSPWCKLEFLFCQCLVGKWPNSVYVIDGCLQGKGVSMGYYM